MQNDPAQLAKHLNLVFLFVCVLAPIAIAVTVGGKEGMDAELSGLRNNAAQVQTAAEQAANRAEENPEDAQAQEVAEQFQRMHQQMQQNVETATNAAESVMDRIAAEGGYSNFRPGGCPGGKCVRLTPNAQNPFNNSATPSNPTSNAVAAPSGSSTPNTSTSTSPSYNPSTSGLPSGTTNNAPISPAPHAPSSGVPLGSNNAHSGYRWNQQQQGWNFTDARSGQQYFTQNRNYNTASNAQRWDSVSLVTPDNQIANHSVTSGGQHVFTGQNGQWQYSGGQLSQISGQPPASAQIVTAEQMTIPNPPPAISPSTVSGPSSVQSPVDTFIGADGRLMYVDGNGEVHYYHE